MLYSLYYSTEFNILFYIENEKNVFRKVIKRNPSKKYYKYMRVIKSCLCQWNILSMIRISETWTKSLTSRSQ